MGYSQLATGVLDAGEAVGIPPEEDLETLKALELLDFKGYYVFILTNVSFENPIPNVLPPTDTEI